MQKYGENSWKIHVFSAYFLLKFPLYVHPYAENMVQKYGENTWKIHVFSACFFPKFPQYVHPYAENMVQNMFANKYSKHSENSQYFQNILEIENFPKYKIDSLHSARRPESVPERRLISKIFSTRRGGALPR